VSKTGKGRHWAFVAYPESVAPDWLEQLKQSGLKVTISPLHDKDTHSDPAIEDSKKPHWHCIVTWGNTTTLNAVKAFTVDKLKATIPVKLESVKGYYRYFIHADDPDKYQYDPAEIQHIGGFDMRDHSDMTRSERMDYIAEVQEFIELNNIMEYRQLTWSLYQTEGKSNRWEVAMTNTLLFNAYITSRRNEIAAVAAKEDAERDKQI
jgi:hypothetical protein